jgi:hypothetical protein
MIMQVVRGTLEGLQQHGQGQLAVQRHQPDGRHQPQGRGLGRGGKAGIDRPDHDGEEPDGRHQVRQPAQPFAPQAPAFDPVPAPLAPPQDQRQDDAGKQPRQHQPGQEPRRVEIGDRGIGQHRVDDHVDRRRDQDA